MKMINLNILGVLVLSLLVSCSGRASAESVTSPREISDSSQLVTFIELGSVDCIPCKAMQPIMDQMREELEGQVEVVFHDVWTEEGQPFGQQYGIRVIPTQIFLDTEGKEYFRHEGYFPIEELYPVLERGGVILP